MPHCYLHGFACCVAPNIDLFWKSAFRVHRSWPCAWMPTLSTLNEWQNSSKEEVIKKLRDWPEKFHCPLDNDGCATSSAEIKNCYLKMTIYEIINFKFPLELKEHLLAQSGIYI